MLVDRLRNDLNEAVRIQKEPERTTLRGVLAAIRNEEINLGVQSSGLTDEQVQKVVNKLIKQREESIQMFIQGNRYDLVQKEKDEQTVLRRYVPDQPTIDMIKPHVQRIISEKGLTSMKDMSVILLELRSLFGNVDGKLVKELAEPVLGGKK